VGVREEKGKERIGMVEREEKKRGREARSFNSHF